MGRNFFNTQAGASDEATGAGPDAHAGADVGAEANAATGAADQDASHGQGGLYELRDGQRVLIERTAERSAQEGSAA